MKLQVFALGLLLMGLSIILMSSSNLSYEKPDPSWDIVRTEVDAVQISSNFTKGDKVKLAISPTSLWLKFLEPEVDDVPYHHKFVFVNISDPHGNMSEYEVTFARLSGSSALSIYKITLLSPDGFGSQEEKEIIWEVKYSGEYTAEVWGILPPGGGPPGTLTFLKEKIIFTTEYPYSSCLYPAIAMFPIGVALTVWGAKTSKRKVSVRRKTRVKKR